MRMFHLNWIIFICLALYGVVRGAGAVKDTRNGVEEAICQPFLTSASTSPLNGRIMPRNLTIDEDGEFACMLVLQDVNLPNQIRVTIHEGLMWLGVRHVFMGLPNHHMIMYHLDWLTKILPDVASFHIKAAEWSLDPNVGDYEKAKNYYLAVYNGSCSENRDIDADDDYHYKRRLAEVLGYLGYYDDVRMIYRQLLNQYPYDFTVAFMLREVIKMFHMNDTSDPIQDSILLQPAASLYASIEANQQFVNYTGFIPATGYNIMRYRHMISSSEMDDHIFRREPFVISLGDDLSTTLGWNTKQWKEMSYMASRLDDQQKVQVEYQAYDEGSVRSMGYGLGNYRKITTFHNFLSKCLASSSSTRQQAYLNVQLDGLRYDLNPFLNPKLNLSSAIPTYYNPPLNHLVDDIPLPSMLHDKELTDVNLWMNSPVCSHHIDIADPVMVSRLHVDATDNMYVLLQGKKEFVIADPSQAVKMKTVLPTYAVASNGLSFRYNPIQYPLDDHSQPQRAPTFSQDVITGHFSSIPSLKDESRIHSVAVELQEGDILYLPTGWFHQVTSKGKHHMAINYWWKPPQWKEMVRDEKEFAKALKMHMSGASDPELIFHEDL